MSLSVRWTPVRYGGRKRIKHALIMPTALLLALFISVPPVTSAQTNDLSAAKDIALTEIAPSGDGTRGERGDMPIPELIPGLEYVAIGPSEFADEMEPLITWKTSKGTRARYYTLDGEDSILTRYPGRDDEERIRTFIQLLVKKHEPTQGERSTVRWLLLVGDGEIIPSRRTYVNWTGDIGSEDPDNYVLSDYYYAGLDGTWNYNNNTIFGEEGEQDWEAEVYVGRFPASTEEEVDLMVLRQIAYESDPPTGSWSESMLLAGSLMDRPNRRDNRSTSYIDEGYNFYKDNAYELVQKVEGDLPDHVTPFHLLDYPQMEYGGYNRLFDTLNRTSFLEYYETGFSTVLMACHGDSFNGNCTDYRGESGGNLPYSMDHEDYFDYEMAETVENGRKLPLVYISSCASTNFTEEDDTNMERIMLNSKGGAIGLIGSTATTYRGEYYDDETKEESSWGNWWLARRYFQILYHDTPHPGEALYLQKYQYSQHILEREEDEWRMYRIDGLSYNLLGDPEGQIWLAEPRGLIINPPDHHYYNERELVISVMDPDSGLPKQDARVTVTKPSDLSFYHTTTTDDYGKAVLQIELGDLTPLNVVACAKGHVPSSREIEVVSPYNLSIDPRLEIYPEIPTYGESMWANVTISNTGEVELSKILITSYLEDENGQVDLTKPMPWSKIEALSETTTWNMSFTPLSGHNTLRVVAELTLGEVESSLEDNSVTVTFRSNIPPDFPYVPNRKIEEDTPLSKSKLNNGRIDLKRYISDVDSFPNQINILSNVTSGKLEVDIDSDLLLDIIPAPDWFGEGVIMFTASDGVSAVTREMTVKVLPTPDPPEFLSFPANILAYEDVETNFTVVLKDVDYPLTSDITLNVSLEGVTIERMGADNLSFNITFCPGEELVGKPVVINLTASDSAGNSTALIRLTVEPTNDDPEVEPPLDLQGVTGSSVEVSLEVTDPDGDIDFTIEVIWEFGEYEYYSTSFIIEIPDDAAEDSYPVTVHVRDGNGGNATVSFSIDVIKDSGGPYTTHFFLIGLFLLLLVVFYGAFVKMQERKDRKILDEVGTNATLEVRGLSEEDFEEEEEADLEGDSIPMPPAPSDVEGPLVRQEMEAGPIEEEGADEVDEPELIEESLDTELDEILKDYEDPMDPKGDI